MIPSSARATVNHRVHPGNTLEEVREPSALEPVLFLFNPRYISQDFLIPFVDLDSLGNPDRKGSRVLVGKFELNPLMRSGRGSSFI